MQMRGNRLKMKQVRFIPTDKIERQAEDLLADYSCATGIPLEPPIDVDQVAERYLRLTLEIDDLHQRLGVGRNGPNSKADIQGALMFETRTVVIDESLDPDQKPNYLGRFRFTLAHECAHWCLHRDLFRPALQVAEPFGAARPIDPSIVCMSEPVKPRIEIQADLFAAALLMPRSQVKEVWEDFYPDGQPRILEQPDQVWHDFEEIVPAEQCYGDYCWPEPIDDTLERIAKPMADIFEVSTPAMRVRLEKLGLLLREVPAPARLFAT